MIRISRSDPVDTTYYVYDGMFAIAELDGSLDLKAKYVYTNGMLVGKFDADDELFQYFHDGLGSITMITDTTGNDENLYVYDDLGNFRMSEEAVSNSYYYTGQERDPAPSGLYNLRARYYAAGIGRFTQEDPVLKNDISSSGCCLSGCNKTSSQRLAMRFTFPQELNPYPYVSNDPINFIDISGADRYDMCDNTRGIVHALCKKLVDRACRISPQTCCSAESMDCLADLTGSEAEAAEIFNEFKNSEYKCMPADEKLQKCLLDYPYCLLEVILGRDVRPYQR